MKDLANLETVLEKLNEQGTADNPPGGDMIAGLAATPDSAPPSTTPDEPGKAKSDDMTMDDVPPEEQARQVIEDALEDDGVMTVLIRQDEGNTYWDVVFPEDLTMTITFAKVVPEEGKEPVWTMLVLTPNEVFSTQVKEENIDTEADEVRLPDAVDLEFLQGITGKFTNPDYQIECYTLESMGGVVGDLGKPIEKSMIKKHNLKRSDYRRKKMVR